MCHLKFISKLLAGAIGAMFLLALLLHGATNQAFLHRDKNGTSGGGTKKQWLANHLFTRGYEPSLFGCGERGIL